MAAVELGRDLHGQRQRAPRRLHAAPCPERARTKLPPRPTNALTLPSQHALAGLDRAMPFSRGGSKPYSSVELVERHELRLFGDADRALALHVGVAAHRADAGAGLADIAAQQQQIASICTFCDALAMLGQAHAVDADHGASRARRRRAAASRCGARRGPTALDLVPVRLRARASANASKPCVCSAMKACVEHARRCRPLDASSSASISALQMPDDRRDVAADLRPGDIAC